MSSAATSNLHVASAAHRRPFAGMLALALVAVVALAFWPVLRELERSAWTTLGYSHGYLVALVVGYLVWEQGRPLERSSRDAPAALGLLLVVLAGWLLARFAAIDLLQQLAVPTAAWLLAVATFGREGGRRLALPIGYFVFAIPVWDALVPTLQDLTTHAVEFALAVARIPAHIEGNLVAVPAGTFEIAGGCSGEHLLVVALAVSTLLAHERRVRLGVALRLVAAATALALLTNWVRVFVVIERGNATDMQSSLVHHHYWFGWWLFAAAMAAFIAVARWREAHWELRPARAAAPYAGPRPWHGMAAALLMLGAATGYAALHERDWPDGAALRLALPAAAGGWSGPWAPAGGGWRPGFGLPAQQAQASYQGPEGAVELAAVVYGRQAVGAKLVGYGSGIAPEHWTVLGDDVRPPPSGLPRAVSAVRRALLRDPLGERWVAWYWYEVGDRALAEPLAVKLRQGLQALGPLSPSGALALAAHCAPDCATADRAIAAGAAVLGNRLHLTGLGGLLEPAASKR